MSFVLLLQNVILLKQSSIIINVMHTSTIAVISEYFCVIILSAFLQLTCCSKT